MDLQATRGQSELSAYAKDHEENKLLASSEFMSQGSVYHDILAFIISKYVYFTVPVLLCTYFTMSFLLSIADDQFQC